MKGYRFPQFIKLPTFWIEKEGGLLGFKWTSGGSDNTAALLALIAIAHRVDEQGIARITYDQLEEVLNISRAKLAAGLKILFGKDLLQHEPAGQSTYKLVRYGEQGKGDGQGWGKLPARGLYHEGILRPFKDFRYRKVVELHAVKIYLLFVARRDAKQNEIKLSWKKISEYSGVPTDQIKAATSLLIENKLVTVDSITDWKKWDEKHTQPNLYRLAHVDPHLHNGTLRGKDSDNENGSEEIDFSDMMATVTQSIPVK